jgi:large subunit ribosomal protein L35
MPKMKTHKGAKKRTKVSGTGKIMRKKANASHLLSKKSGKRKRSLRGNHALAGGDAKNLKKALNIS